MLNGKRITLGGILLALFIAILVMGVKQSAQATGDDCPPSISQSTGDHDCEPTDPPTECPGGDGYNPWDPCSPCPTDLTPGDMDPCASEPPETEEPTPTDPPTTDVPEPTEPPVTEEPPFVNNPPAEFLEAKRTRVCISQYEVKVTTYWSYDGGPWEYVGAKFYPAKNSDHCKTDTPEITYDTVEEGM